MGSFVPLLFSTFGGMGHAAAIFCERLAYLLSLQKGSSVIPWLHCMNNYSASRELDHIKAVHFLLECLTLH